MNWKPIAGWPYSVSDTGKVRNDRTGFILKGNANQKGYLLVDLKTPRARKCITVHSLVALEFLGARPSVKHQINHIDGDKTNNSASNLEYVTPSQNVAHAFKSGLREQKLTAQDVELIRGLNLVGMSVKEISERYKMNRSYIYSICLGRRRNAAVI